MKIRRELVEDQGHVRRGVELLHDPKRNKGTGFSPDEREALGLRGLLPAQVLSVAEQVERALENIRRSPDALQQYITLAALQDRNETLYYRTLIDNLVELMPIVYTPTVGRVCQEFGHIFRRPRGLFLSIEDRGSIRELLRNWPLQDVSVIVVTDGERILGLGDLGANGMGIPVGKLSLYTACAGINPYRCLPITLDVGTDNETLRRDPLYVGLRQPRLRGAAYDDFVEEFMTAVMDAFPLALLQFEDFGNYNAFRLLHRYRDRTCCFNDDIQGTAAVALAGILSALRLCGGSLAEQRLLFLGAGEAGTGIAELFADELIAGGMAADEAHRHCWLVDSKGLITAARAGLAPNKQPFAHACDYQGDFAGAVDALQPTALIGVSGQPQTFTEPVVRAMASNHERPLIFALSNPTSKAECTARQAYEWTDGRAIFASGSPFDPVELNGHRHWPGQGNNAYIFPGVGLGVVGSGARRVPDEIFRLAARVLAQQVTERDLASGCVYPPLGDIRAVSLAIAAAVATFAWDNDLTAAPRPEDIRGHLQTLVFEPVYQSYVEA